MRFTKAIHEKLSIGIQKMIADTNLNFPFYGYFATSLNYIEVKDDDPNIQTCAVNVSRKGMNFYYNNKFLNNLSQQAVNFVIIHELFHLIFSHSKRTIMGNYNPNFANMVQDMIINHLILDDVPAFFVEIPKDSKGKNMGLLVPVEYEGKLLFEELYEWLMEKKREREDKKNKKGQGQSGKGQGQSGKGKGDNQDGQGQGQGDNQDGQGDNQDGQGQGQGDGQDEKDSNGKPAYGPYGKNPKPGKHSPSNTIDTYSLDKLLDDIENGGNGSYLDSHIPDEVSSEERQNKINAMIQSAKNRGLVSGNVEGMLEKLRPKKKDYLREIKKNLANGAFGMKKIETIRKPNRKSIEGVKGKKKINTEINVILDVSGSMSGGLIEKTLSYIFKQEVVVNMIQADTQVNKVERFTNTKKIQDMKIIGFGGTELMPAIRFIEGDDKLNKFATVILTDGYCDNLDTSGLRKNCLIISCGTRVNVYSNNGKTKQIMVED